MPRNTIYYRNFTEQGIRYRWEMIPAAQSIPSQSLGAPTYTDMGELFTGNEGSFTSEYPDKYPLGIPEKGACTLTLNVDHAPDADIVTYLSENTQRYGLVQYEDSLGNPVDLETLLNYDVGGNATIPFPTSNVWTLFSDKGNSALTTDNFEIIFQGVQKRSDSITLRGTKIEITLGDIIGEVLKTITPLHVTSAMLAEQVNITDIDTTPTYSYTTKTSRAAWDYLYKESTAVYGQCLYVDFNKVISDDSTINVQDECHYYKLEDLYDAIHKCVHAVYSAFIRQLGTISVTGSPLDATTMYAQNYLADGLRGSAVANNSLWFIGLAKRLDERTDPPYDYGFLFPNDANGMAKNHETLWDFLKAHVESMGMYMRWHVSQGNTLNILYRKPKQESSWRTFTLASDIGGTTYDDIEIEKNYERIRACTAVTPSMNSQSVKEVQYSQGGSDAESDYSLKFPLCSSPMLHYGDRQNTLKWGSTIAQSLSASYKQVFIEPAFYTGRIYYFATPSFSSAEYPIVPHHQIDYSDGSSTYTTPLNHPLPTGIYIGLWQTYGHSELTSITIDYQRRSSHAAIMAKAVSDMFSKIGQAFVEVEVKAVDASGNMIDMAALGRRVTVDFSAISSFHASLPTVWHIVAIDTDIHTNRAKISLFGMG